MTPAAPRPDLAAWLASGAGTLPAVCPNSAAVVRAALRAGQWAGAPVLFAATLNQVDRDGGYTGWTPAAFAAFVHAEARRLGVPVLLGLDHGGPWKKDRHVKENYPYEETRAAVLRSIEACLAAGYGLLHLDVTTDLRGPVPAPALAARTVDLMAHAEACRRRAGLPPLVYEAGVEEAGGPPDREARLDAYLHALDAALTAAHLPRPLFIVADVGTRLDGTGFDRAAARRMARRVRAFGAYLKVHYTDGVTDLAAFPALGIGGANVGPGLAAVEYDALMDLAARARRLGHDVALEAALRDALIAGGRWEKWRRPDEAGLPFEALSPARQDWLLRTGSRYVWTAPAVVAARQALVHHLDPYTDVEAVVVWRLTEALLRYYHAFKGAGLSSS